MGLSLFRTAFAVISPRVRDSVCVLCFAPFARSASLRVSQSGRSLSIAGSLSISPHCNGGAKLKASQTDRPRSPMLVRGAFPRLGSGRSTDVAARSVGTLHAYRTAASPPVSLTIRHAPNTRHREATTYIQHIHTLLPLNLHTRVLKSRCDCALVPAVSSK